MGITEISKVPSRIEQAFTAASRSTGVNFDYLLKTAVRESSLDPSAKAKTSSASGLFQFIDSTWLETMKAHGEKFGLGRYSAQINVSSSGKHSVPNQQARKEIMALRHNPEVSALMAGAFTRDNFEQLDQKVGRTPTSSELYMAHFMGAEGASQLINANARKPGASAVELFPRQAKANRAIFYSRGGKERSIGEVYANLARHHRELTKVATPQAGKASGAASVQLEKPVARVKELPPDAPVPRALVQRQNPAGFNAASSDPLNEAFKVDRSKSFFGAGQLHDSLFVAKKQASEVLAFAGKKNASVMSVRAPLNLDGIHAKPRTLDVQLVYKGLDAHKTLPNELAKR